MVQHTVILVPGLGDRVPRHQWLTRQWEKDGIQVVMHTAPWDRTDEPLAPKLNHLLEKIDDLHKKGYTVSLVGTSAGGSLVLNAFSKRKSQLQTVINVCGRVRKGTNVFPSLEMAAKGFPAFAQSVIACEKELKSFTPEDRRKILCVNPFLFDGVVPMSCMKISGATSVTVPMPSHILGIAAALSIWRKPLIEFIKMN